MLALSPGRAQAFGCRNVPYCLLAATAAAACSMTRIAAIMGHGPRLPRRTPTRARSGISGTPCVTMMLTGKGVSRANFSMSTRSVRPGTKYVSTGIGISLCTLCRFIEAFIRRSEFRQKRIGSRIDEQTNSEFLRSFSHCFDLRCMLIGTDELPLSPGEPVFDIDPYRAGLQNPGHRRRRGVRRVAISCLQID